MKKVLKNNGLSLVFLLMFMLSFLGQLYSGLAEHNKEREQEGQQTIKLSSYFYSGHFLQSTFENWESEFLQMALFVVLTISLRQKGSSESKSFDEPEEVDREPDPSKKGAPWAVRQGGWILTIYKHSLTISLLVLFLLSFAIHLYGSWKDENEQLTYKRLPKETIQQYLTDSRFWFESFQNWQSEFLSVFAIIVLSIFLRQKGSSQSKPVDAAHSDTGE